MSLGENLQFLRKRNDITQEQLAEKLNVSRQSVSKWESDTAFPEMDKLIQLSEMFNCSLDDIIKKDISINYVEDKSNYDEHMNLFSKMIALGVGLILLGLSLTSFLHGINVNEELAGIVFFIFVIIAVAIFIVMGLQHDNFEKKNAKIDNFYTQDEIETFNKKFIVFIAAGVVLILVATLIFLSLDNVLSEVYINSYLNIDELVSSLFFLLLSIAVSLLIYAGIQKQKYNIQEYNETHDKNSVEYKKEKITGTVCGCLMMTATIIYLICGFVFEEWGVPSIAVFPVFGIGCGIAAVVIDLKYR